MQNWPIGQVIIAQSFSMQIPLGSHVLLEAQGRHMQFGWHTPSMHTSSMSQVTPAHASTHELLRHVCPCGHVTPAHSPIQIPSTHR
jgi:hypothetical protein